MVVRRGVVVLAAPILEHVQPITALIMHLARHRAEVQRHVHMVAATVVEGAVRAESDAETFQRVRVLGYALRTVAVE